MNANSVILAILALLLFIAIVAAISLLYLYLSLKSRITRQVDQERESWRESARKEAQDQLARWREQELDLAEKQQFELAHSEAILQLEKWKHEQEQVIRQDAVQRSQSVTIGKITEHLMPYLPGFSYNPKDVRFIGSPIDLIIFDGLNDGEVRKVILVEVKTGASKLSPRERRLRDAVQAGRVEWIEYRPSVDANSTGFEG